MARRSSQGKVEQLRQSSPRSHFLAAKPEAKNPGGGWDVERFSEHRAWINPRVLSPMSNGKSGAARPG